jgi:hypothetical protein
MHDDRKHLTLCWERFNTFQDALKKFKRVACLYVLADKDERILRFRFRDNAQRYSRASKKSAFEMYALIN